MNTNCQESNSCNRAIEAAATTFAVHSLWADTTRRAFALLLVGSESFSIWLKRDRHLSALERLSDHTLKDIGLARSDIDRGVHRLL